MVLKKEGFINAEYIMRLAFFLRHEYGINTPDLAKIFKVDKRIFDGDIKYAPEKVQTLLEDILLPEDYPEQDSDRLRGELKQVIETYRPPEEATYSQKKKESDAILEILGVTQQALLGRTRNYYESDPSKTLPVEVVEKIDFFYPMVEAYTKLLDFQNERKKLRGEEKSEKINRLRNCIDNFVEEESLNESSSQNSQKLPYEAPAIIDKGYTRKASLSWMKPIYATIELNLEKQIIEENNEKDAGEKNKQDYYNIYELAELTGLDIKVIKYGVNNISPSFRNDHNHFEGKKELFAIEVGDEILKLYGP